MRRLILIILTLAVFIAGQPMVVSASSVKPAEIKPGRTYAYSTPVVSKPDAKSYKIANPSAGTTISVTTDAVQTSQNKILFTAFDVEFSFSLSMPFTSTMGSVSGDKVATTGSNIDVSFFPVAPKEGFNDLGGLDWLMTYKTKPALNVLSFPFSSTGVSAYAQLPLTSDEIKEGAERPDYVVNSIAFYASGKSGDLSALGGKNYRTGKIGHLYRMWAIDSKGAKTWTDWGINGGTISLTIPTVFWNTAVYPVTLQPAGDTFGFSGTPGTSASYATGNILSWGDTYTGTAGTGISMSFYARKNTNNQNLQMAIYDAASPSNLIANSNTPSVLVDSTTAKWWNSTYVSAPALTAVPYYLTVEDDGSIYLYYDATGTSTTYKYKSNTFNAWPSTITWSTAANKHNFGIYVTYTPAASGWTNIAKIFPGGILENATAKFYPSGALYANINKLNGIAVNK